MEALLRHIPWLRSRFYGHRGRDVQLWVFAIIYVALERAVVREASGITFFGLLCTAWYLTAEFGVLEA